MLTDPTTGEYRERDPAIEAVLHHGPSDQERTEKQEQDRVSEIPERLASTLAELTAEGRIAPPADEDPLAFLMREGGARDVIDAAYRYCRHAPGADVILFGTGSTEHLATNIGSILAPPLAPGAVARLEALFGALVGVGLDAPGRARR